MCRRSFVGNGCWLQNEMGEMELAAELGEFLGYRCAEKWKQEATIAGKLMEIICDPERFVGLSMSLGNPLIRSVKQEIKRAHVEKDTLQRVGRPLTCGVLARMQDCVPYRGVGRRLVRIGVALFYFLCCGHRNCSRGRSRSSMVCIVCGGGMWRFSE